MGFRVLTAEWHHETNTFSIVPTDVQAFHDFYYFHSEANIRRERHGTKSVLGATYEAAKRHGWTLVNTVCAQANPAGRVTDEAFEEIAKHILAPLSHTHTDDTHTESVSAFDGIVLHLHGAMVTASHEDAEGELLRRIRALVGPHIPIIVSLDLHGNITQEMARHATALIAVRTYPHVDFYETALSACELLQRCMCGEVRPYTAIAKRPQLWGLDGGKTHAESPMTTLIERGAALERDGQCLVVSVCAGFTAADILEIGPSVTVTVDLMKQSHTNDEGAGDNEEAKKDFAQRIAEEFMDFSWETRRYKSEIHREVEEVVQYAEDFLTHRHALSERPLVIADVTDNPGSGHYGDATNLLAGLVAKKVSDVVFYAICDAQAVLQGERIGVGRTGEITLGGRRDPSCGGAPLTLRGKVVSLTDGCFQTFGPMGFGGVWQNYGLSMCFRVADTSIDVIVISNNGQLLDIAQITSLGIDPLHKKVIAVKSKQHFRACLAPIAAEIVTVDGGGLGSAILKGGEYKHVRRPIWPLDDI